MNTLVDMSADVVCSTAILGIWLHRTIPIHLGITPSNLYFDQYLEKGYMVLGFALSVQRHQNCPGKKAP
jgi:hypothetical protein